MRVIFLSPVHPLLTPGNQLPRWQMQASWIRGLEKVGTEVKVVRYTPEDRIRLGWGERVWWNLKVVREVNREVQESKKKYKKVQEGKIDFIIYSLGADVLFPQTLRLVKWLVRAPLVVLSGVSPILNGNPRERAVAKLMDMAAVNDEKHAGEWRKLGAKKAIVLPISGIDPELHFNKGQAFVFKGLALRDIDVLFIGTLTPARKEFIGLLRKLLPESINFVVKEFVWEEEYARMMSRAKIVLNPIRPEMAGGANLRMFEIPAFGALELGSFGKKEWLTPGKEMLVYKDAEEAARLIVRYLKEGKKREEMAGRGKRRVLEEHKFEDRARKLIELIKMDFNKAWPLIDLSVCIVNYRTDKELKRCLGSIKKFTKGINFEVIAIDNSLDNRWYSGGNNLALARAKGKYILFLNPDCYLAENSLAKMIGWVDKHPKVGACEPRQVYDDGDIAPTGSLFPVWWVDLVELTELSRWFGSVGRLGKLGRLDKIKEIRQENLDRRENWQTEVISGAAMMVRKSILDEISAKDRSAFGGGVFDEQLKLYYTDVDLCRRILRAGCQIWHLGKFKVGHSTRKSTEKLKWDDLYDIYAEDGWNYYSKWGQKIGGIILFGGMKVNKAITKMIKGTKVLKDIKDKK